ncbi:glucosamine-6-phosphate deaminase [Bacillus sp. AK031]
MEIIKVKNYSDMCTKAAQLVIERVNDFSAPVLGLATGGTPKGLYEKLIENHQKGHTSYRHVTTFNLDEYAGLPQNDQNSYFHYMNERLFKHIDIDKGSTHLPDGMADDIKKECIRYEAEIAKHGGIDLQILGIGMNGHIGFNEPGTSFSANTHVVNLTESTREANARYFSSIEKVPRKALTMGINTILKSKEILLLISGESKQEAVKRLLEGDITEEFPASILKKHPNVKVLVDKAALKHVCGVKKVEVI